MDVFAALLFLVSVGCIGGGLISIIVRKVGRRSTKTAKRLVLYSLVGFVVSMVLATVSGGLDGAADEKTSDKSEQVEVSELVKDASGSTTEELDEDSEAGQDSNVPAVTESTSVSWKDTLPSGLAKEIEDAFIEIGENPDNIDGIEYVDTHTTGHIFERKCYKVEFSYSFMNPGWKHAKQYRVTTQNYFDGEPEKAEYPDEFLVTLKYWAGDDGHGTNINQWSWTGGGENQED